MKLFKKLGAGMRSMLAKTWAARQQWALPLVLIAILIIQTQVFNAWLSIQASFLFQRFLSSLFFGLLVFGPAMVLRRRGRYIWLSISAFLVELLLVSQFIYFLSFNTFIRGSAMRYASYVGAVSGSIKVQLNPSLLFFAVMLPVIALWYFLIERKKPEPRYRLRTRLIALVGILLITFAAFAGVLIIEQRKHHGLGELLRVPYDNTTMVTKVGVLTYSAFDTYRYLTSPRGITPKEKAYVEAWNKTRPAPQQPGSSFGIAKGKNVILIQMESFESFAINRTIEGQEITPNLNKLVKESMYYPNYHDEVSTGRTADGEFETQNSLLPTMDRVAFFDYATHDYHALPEILGEQGYTTSVYHGDNKTFWNRNVAYPYVGWKDFHGIEAYKVNRPVGWGLSDQDLIEQTIPYLAKHQQPFYTNIITVSSHTPFDIPKDLQVLTLKEKYDISNFQLNFIQSLAYVDKQLGTLMNELKANGLYDKSVIALFGDHRGFISNENDAAFAKFLGYTKGDRLSYFLDGEKVPLIVRAPGGTVTGIDTQPASHLDYAPTILGLLGTTKPQTMLGQDLLSPRVPVAIQRNSAGGIEIIQTNEVLYANPGDGNFASGKCFAASDRKQIALEKCKTVYDQQSSMAKVNDIVIRGDALYLLK